jgi:hypothetical protein
MCFTQRHSTIRIQVAQPLTECKLKNYNYIKNAYILKANLFQEALAHSIKSLPISQNSTDLRAILSDATSIIDLFERLPWYAAAHIGASSSRQKSNITEIIDSLLPFIGCFLGCVDVLDILAVDQVDGVADPLKIRVSIS